MRVSKTVEIWINSCLAVLESLLFCGLIHGWASITFVLKEEYVYGDLCDDDDVIGNQTTTSGDVEKICPAQDRNLVMCYSVAIAIQSFSTVVFAFLIYKLGIKHARIASYSTFTAGCVCMAFVSKDIPWLIYPGWALIGVGGYGTFLSNYQVSTLFKTRSAIFIALLNGALDSSVIVTLSVKMAVENGFSRQNMFFIIGGLHLMVLLRSIFLLPKSDKSTKESTDDKENAVTEDDKRDTNIDDNRRVIGTLRDCFRQPLLYTHALWVCLLTLRLFFYLGTLNQYFNTVFNGDNQLVSQFTNVFNYILLASLATSFVSGLLYYQQECRVKALYVGERSRKLMAAVVPLSLTSLLAVLTSVLVMFDHRVVVYICFAVLPFYRSFLFSYHAAFVYSVFPDRFTSVMYGTLSFAIGISSFLQYALYTWSDAYRGAVMHVNICFLVLTCLTFIHPGYLWFSGSRMTTCDDNLKIQSVHM